MTAFNTRTDKRLRLSHSHALFGQSRETLDEAYPGDIVAFVAKPDLQIGDTISDDASIEFHAIPRFAPECFAYLNNPTPAAYKPFRRGLEQLLSENIVQVFKFKDPSKANRILLGAVGVLQFEVLQYRLKTEYGAPSELELQSFSILRWIRSSLEDQELKRMMPYESHLAEDELGRRVILFISEWSANRFAEDHKKDVALSASPFATAMESEETGKTEAGQHQ
jgi:peptide chain release factor 3